MGNRFASGKWAIAQCDRCDGRYKLKELRREVIKGKNYELLVCKECWDPDQPQLHLGEFPVDDPQGLRNPRPDRSYVTSGLSGLQLINSTSPSPDAQGTVQGGSRIFQWGWNPVGGASAWDTGLTPNNLILSLSLGTVTVTETAPASTTTINFAAVVTGLLQAAVNTNPGKQLFKDTVVLGRPLGAIVNGVTISSADALAYNKWYNRVAIPIDQVAYIVGTLNPYMLANSSTYSAYLIFS